MALPIRLIDQVDQHLFKTQGVADEDPVAGFVDENGDFNRFFFGFSGKQIADIAKYTIEVEWRIFEFELAGLDLREVEDIVDDAQQEVGGLLDFRQVVALLLAWLRGQTQLRHADDGVHRRAYLVAHVGEKVAACLGQPFGLELRLNAQFFQTPSFEYVEKSDQNDDQRHDARGDDEQPGGAVIGHLLHGYGNERERCVIDVNTGYGVALPFVPEGAHQRTFSVVGGLRTNFAPMILYAERRRRIAVQRHPAFAIDQQAVTPRLRRSELRKARACLDPGH